VTLKGIVKNQELMKVANKGNLVTRRCFSERDGVRLKRIEELAQITGKAGSTAYQMTEEVSPFGSGTPSPLHNINECIRYLVDIDDIHGAIEMADNPRLFLNQLRGGEVAGDAINKNNLLLKAASDANYLLAGRDLKDLPLGQLKEYAQMIMTIRTTSSEIEQMIDAQMQAKESSHNGAPIPGERLRQAS